MGWIQLFVTLSIFIGFQSFAQSPSASEPRLLSLKEAVNQALEQNPDLALAREKQIAAREQHRKSFSLLFPNIYGEGNYLVKKDAVAGGAALFRGESYNTYDASLNLQQPIIRGGALWSGPAATSATRALSDIDYQIAERDQILLVTQAFFNVLVSQKSVETYERQVEVQRQLLAKAGERFRFGAENRLVVLQFKTQLALLQPKLVDARNKLETAGMQLLNLLGDHHTASVRVRGDLNRGGELSTPDALKMDFVDSERLEVKREKLRQDEFESQRAVLMEKDWPSLSGVARIGRAGTEQSALSDEDATSWYAGLQLKVPLFSGLSSVFERRTLASQGQQLRIQEKKVRDQVTLESVQIVRDLEAARVGLSTSREAFELAQQAQNEARRLYNVGRIDYQTVFNVQRDLLEAELNFARAQYDHIVTIARFYVVSGKPLKELVEKL